MPGIVATQSGHVVISTSPNAARVARASLDGLALDRAPRSSRRVEDARRGPPLAVTGNVTWPFATVGIARLDLDRVLDEPVVGSDVRAGAAPRRSSSTGDASTAITVPVAVSPRSNVSTSWPTSVAGSTVGVASPRTAVSGKTGRRPGRAAPASTAVVNASGSSAVERPRSRRRRRPGRPAGTPRGCRRSSRPLLRTVSVSGSSAAGMTVIVFGSTLPAVPGFDGRRPGRRASVGKIGRPDELGPRRR